MEVGVSYFCFRWQGWRWGTFFFFSLLVGFLYDGDDDGGDDGDGDGDDDGDGDGELKIDLQIWFFSRLS